MNIKEELEKFELTPDNAVVIGSGILNALNIRKSNDIDLVVTKNAYKQLSADNCFHKAENHGQEILASGLLEVGTSWDTLGKILKFEDFLKESIVIDGVRYIKPEFLLAFKRSKLLSNDVRQKDIDDVKLIENYFKLPKSDFGRE